MFKGFFNRSQRTFQDFITELRNGEDDFFKLLRTSEKEFQECSFNELMANQDDILSGVNRVQKNFKNIYFNIFKGCLIKHHDNGSVKLVLYTTTDNVKTVIEFSQILFNEFGQGYYKENEFTPFTNHEKVILLSKGIFKNQKDDIAHIWLYKHLSILLQYKVNPLRQFSLMITKKLPVQANKEIRRKGTILNLLDIDVNKILSQKELSQIANVTADKINFIDYTFRLNKREMEVFDKIIIRIKGQNRIFSESNHTQITLLSTTSIDSDSKIKIAEKLVSLYGEDDIGRNELEMYERDLIEQNEFWTGRKWSFNESHGLWDIDSKAEKLSYSVSFDNDADEKGFSINILSYNDLVSLFKVKE